MQILSHKTRSANSWKIIKKRHKINYKVVISVVPKNIPFFRKYKNISHFLWRRRSKALSFRTFQQGNNGFYGHECCLFSSWNLMVTFMAIYCAHNLKDEFKRHNVFYWLSFLIYRSYYKISIFFQTIFNLLLENFLYAYEEEEGGEGD